MAVRILHVEPDESLQERFRHALTNTKHELLQQVRCAVDARSALNDAMPDVVVFSMDTPQNLENPEKAGLKFVLNCLSATSPPGVVLVYKHGMEQNVAKGIQYGVAAAVLENATRGEMLEALRKAEEFDPSVNSVRRRRVRMKANLLAWYKGPEDSFFTKMKPTTVANISGGGLRIRAGERVPANSLVKLRLKLPHAKRPLRVLASVRWCSPRDDGRKWDVGLQFSEITKVDRQLLEHYLEGQLAKG